MFENVLVTGGAGFIGSHTIDLLVKKGYKVTVIDNLEPQVHGNLKDPPDYYNENASFVLGNILDRESLAKLISKANAIIHLSALVRVNQSMYQIERYINSNTKGTATLLDILANEEHMVKKLIVASSISVYGEGKYYCEKCEKVVFPEVRKKEFLQKELWDPTCPFCGSSLLPLPIDEESPLMPNSIYGLTKRHQEEMCLLIGKKHNIKTVALRYANVYGSRQAFSSPYAGVCTNFSNRIKNNNPPYIYEDGNQIRDFIHVKDVAMANLKALETDSSNYDVVNVGTGKPTTINELAEIFLDLFKSEIQPVISAEYREGDIRSCYVDLRKINKLLDFQSTIGLREGVAELIEWEITHNKMKKKPL